MLRGSRVDGTRGLGRELVEFARLDLFVETYGSCVYAAYFIFPGHIQEVRHMYYTGSTYWYSMMYAHLKNLVFLRGLLYIGAWCASPSLVRPRCFVVYTYVQLVPCLDMHVSEEMAVAILSPVTPRTHQNSVNASARRELR